MRKFTGVVKPTARGPEELPRILYVEDEELNWSINVKILEGKYALTRAATASEAIDVLRAEADAFRAILMDIQLASSELDGIELTRFLRGDPRQIGPRNAEGFRMEKVPPIIFVTAFTSRYPREELIALGGSDVIGKPVDATKLHLCIARCIAQAATERLSAFNAPRV